MEQLVIVSKYRILYLISSSSVYYYESVYSMFPPIRLTVEDVLRKTFCS